MNSSVNSNIYEFNAIGVLEKYSQFVEGSPDCTVVAVSNEEFVPEVKKAITASMEQLGLASTGQCAWVLLGEELDLWNLVEGLDPLAIVAINEAAAKEMAAAYHSDVPCDAVSHVFGRNVVAFRNLQEMLFSDSEKQRAWKLFKHLSA